ncbi:MAG TPA: MaoC family dehydratase [Dehalococcoidia bacterium]|nr:MaoC family dehydratase [Dehalococcoidia bacterium]
MTQPSAIRPKEGEQPGTPFEAFRAGARLAPMPFTLDAAVVDEYARLLGAELAWYHAPPGETGPLAPATAPALFLLALLYRTFPPVQGLVLTHAAFELLQPWAPGMSISGSGEITETSERRGRQYVSWRAEFSEDAGGRLLTRASNTFTLPRREHQATTPEMRRPGPEPPGGVPVTPLRLKEPTGAMLPGARLELEQGIAISQALIDWYGRLNGDHDVVHYDAPYAAALGYRAPIDHGLMHAAYASELLCQAFGMRWLAGGRYSVKWTAPVYPDDVLFPIAEVAEADGAAAVDRLALEVRCENAQGQAVMVGEASVPIAAG